MPSTKTACASDQPFVTVDCNTLSENLLESELFGYVKGLAHGCRVQQTAGMFEVANQGTFVSRRVLAISRSLPPSCCCGSRSAAELRVSWAVHRHPGRTNVRCRLVTPPTGRDREGCVPPREPSASELVLTASTCPGSRCLGLESSVARTSRPWPFISPEEIPQPMWSKSLWSRNFGRGHEPAG
ncbi:MAG: sigma 54-interacting transcriptional regulator [Ideonella sp.]|nr:sigma 54-interacting transcriptional regulator [Ideonella sp.]